MSPWSIQIYETYQFSSSDDQFLSEHTNCFAILIALFWYLFTWKHTRATGRISRYMIISSCYFMIVIFDFSLKTFSSNQLTFFSLISLLIVQSTVSLKPFTPTVDRNKNTHFVHCTIQSIFINSLIRWFTDKIFYGPAWCPWLHQSFLTNFLQQTIKVLILNPRFLNCSVYRTRNSSIPDRFATCPNDSNTIHTEDLDRSSTRIGYRRIAQSVCRNAKWIIQVDITACESVREYVLYLVE